MPGWGSCGRGVVVIRRCAGRRLQRVWGDGRAGSQFHQIVHNHLVAGLESIENHPVLALPCPHMRRVRRNLIFGICDKYQVALFGLRYRRLGNQKYPFSFTRQDAGADKLAW